jgi:hypothetical protein
MNTATATNQTAELLQAGNDATYRVTTNAKGWIEIRNNPARQIDPAAKLDYLRLWQEDDNYWRLVHLTHNGVLKGEATFSNSLVGAMYGVVNTFFETL